MTILGIDIGNASTKIGHIKNGVVNILLNSQSKRSTKTFISFRDIRYFGDNAYNQLVSNYKYVLYNFKKDLGSGKIYKIKCGNSEYQFNPVQIMVMYAKFLNKLITINNIKSDQLTLAVSENFSILQKNLLHKSFKKDNWGNVNIITQSMAIGLEYSYYKSAKNELDDEEFRNLLFLNIGETEAEISLIRFKSWEMYIVGVISDTNISGIAFKNVLLENCKNFYKNSYKKDVLSGSKVEAKIKKAVDKYFKTLSMNSEIEIKLENIEDERDLIIKFNRNELNEYIIPKIKCIKKYIKTLLKSNKIDENDIYSIELLGGISRVPIIRSWLSQNCKMKIATTLNADECIAKGCTLYSALMSSRIKNRSFKIISKNTHNITIKYNNNNCQKLFKIGDDLPKTKKLTLKVNNTMNIVFNYENENKIHKYSITGIKDDDSPKNIVVVINNSFEKGIVIKTAYYNKDIIETIQTEDGKKENTITKRVLLDFKSNSNEDILADSNEFKKYEDIENRFLVEEKYIENFNSLKNEFEERVYCCKNDMENDIYNKYLNEELNIKLQEKYIDDLDYINDGKLDYIDFDSLEKKLNIYRLVNDNIINNKQKEHNYLYELEKLKKNLIYYKTYFDDKKSYPNFNDKIIELKQFCDEINLWLKATELNNITYNPNSKKYILKNEIILKQDYIKEIWKSAIKLFKNEELEELKRNTPIKQNKDDDDKQNDSNKTTTEEDNSEKTISSNK